MKTFLTVLLVSLYLSTGHASARTHHYPYHNYWSGSIANPYSGGWLRVARYYRGSYRHYTYHMHTHYSGGSCARAAALGGPCGCEAMKIVGLTNTKFWLVANWLAAFPRTTAHVGAAAIWGRHHVEIVSAVHGRTFDSRGSVGFHHVPLSRVTFVEPHA